MEVLQPDSWPEALELKATHPDAVAIAGGTDLMVELNFDRLRPARVLDLTQIEELTQWGPENGHLRVGAGVTYARLIAELGERLPGLAIASRTVGSPQIRNRGTVGGNLGTSSPAGDALPPLFTSDAEVELVSRTGARRVPVGEFVTGPKRNCLAEDELIAAFHIAPADGPQQFAKIGTRNAMVIAVCSLAVSAGDELRASFGSASPRPVLVTAPRDEASSFAERVAEAAAPIDDVRGSERYRRHALRVLTERALKRVLA